MRRNNFLKALLGIPFIAPLIAKGTKEKHYIDMWGNKIPLSEIQNSAINKAMPELGGEDDLWTYRRVAERDNIRVIKTVDMKQIYCNFLPLDGSGIHRKARPRDPFVWREGDISAGLWIKYPDYMKDFSNGLMQISVLKGWEGNPTRWIVTDNGVNHGGYLPQSKLELIGWMNTYKCQPATKAEMIEMIMNSDKNFI